MRTDTGPARDKLDTVLPLVDMMSYFDEDDDQNNMP